jgi:membrane protease YdiL (CAAX protease family)
VNGFAARLRGFGPVGLSAIVVILAANLVVVPLSAILVLLWARASNTPYAALGFERPPSWITTIVFGTVVGISLKLFMKAVVMPLLGAPALNPHFQYLAANPSALPGILYAVVIGAGFGEETVYRGFLFERLGRWLGPGSASQCAVLIITTSIFALAHYPEQGLPGLQQAACTGMVFGGLYHANRQLWMPIVAHAAFDVTAVLLISRGWEAAVARWFLA